MEHKSFYEKKVSIFVFLISQIAMIALFAILYTGYLHRGNVNISQAGSKEPYEKSSEFENLVVDESNQLMSLLMGRSRFEKNGIYDPNRIVDIVDYAQKDIVTGEITHGVGYYLKDLISWAQTGIEYKELYGNDEAPIVERFAPIGYESILDYVDKNGGKASDYYYYLSCTVDNIWNAVWEYNQFKNQFQGEHTNLKYVVEASDKTIRYANTDMTADELLKMNTYIVLDFANLQVETSLTVRNALFLYFNRSISQNLADCRVVIGMDTAFPVKDVFLEGYREYSYWAPIMQWIGLLGMVSGITVILCLAYATITCGNWNREKYYLDRIFPEAVLILVVVICGLIGLAVHAIFRFIVSGINAYIGLAFCAIALNSSMTVCYLTLVRRVKSECLFKESFLYRVICRLRSLLDNRQSIRSTVIGYLMLLAVNIYLLTRNNMPAWIILGLADLAVGYVLVEQAIQRKHLLEAMQKIQKEVGIDALDETRFTGTNKKMALVLNQLDTTVTEAVAKQMKSERLKADLITNVSHDIKTPLTSIINYIDLMKREKIENDRANEYLKILDQKSRRLKALTEDLLEASKISSGNIEIIYSRINLRELIFQTNGEFEEKFEQKNLQLIFTDPGYPIYIQADGRRIWRVLENLYGNAAKYSLEQSRVYAQLQEIEDKAVFTLKNISRQALNIDASELTERFVRGDISRSTEGSGLGLSIAQNLTRLMGGIFEIYLDGDLFRVTVSFPIDRDLNEEQRQEK